MSFQTAFQNSKQFFLEQVVPLAVQSMEYSLIEQELDSTLLLCDRILAAYQEDMDFGRIVYISKHLDELTKDKEPLKVAEDILEDIELWLKSVLSLAKPELWKVKKNDDHYTLNPLIRDLDLLQQTEISLSIDSYHQIPDKIKQSLFLAYRYRNPLTHSPKDYQDFIKARFLPSGLCTLVIPVFKYRTEIKQALSGLIVSHFESAKQTDILTMINSERQKHAMNFRGRKKWLTQLYQKLTTPSSSPKRYILLNGYEGMGKSALVAKLTEEISVDEHIIGRNSGSVRKIAPWLPNTVIHFGKQSNQPHEIVDLLLAQINTLLLEPISIAQNDSKKFSNFLSEQSIPRFDYLIQEQQELRGRNISDFRGEKAYSLNSNREIQSDPFKIENFDFTQYRRTLYLALEKVANERGSIILIIDAVDEISPDGSGLEFLPDVLPIGVSALLSARSDKRVFDWLENNREVEKIRLTELEKQEIPLFTRINSEDGEMQSRFNERIWRISRGWPLIVVEASKLAQENPNNLDDIQIDKSSLFDHHINAWKSLVNENESGLLREVLILLAIFEPVTSLELDIVQSFLERKGKRLSREQIKLSLKFVSAQVEGLETNRIKLALKAFAEYVREKWLGKRDLSRNLDEIVTWLAKEDLNTDLLSQFLAYWTAQDHPKEIREIAETILNDLIANKKHQRTFEIYEYLRKHSKQNHVLTPVMIRCLRSSAELGNSDAMRILGARLIDGAGFTKNVDEGFLWVEKAAEAGSVDAMKVLGNRLIDGKGINPDPTKGAEWLIKAINLEDDEAKYIYANRLIDGDGLSKDAEKGENLLTEMAQQGNEQAIFDLAIRILEGNGLEKDADTGEKMLRDLSARSDFATFVLANRLIDGDEIQADPVEGGKLFQKLIGKGNKAATFVLASRLLVGQGLQTDKQEALKLLNGLANSGDSQAMILLGDLLLKGDVLSSDTGTGIYWLTKAAEDENIDAMLKLSIYLLDGNVVPKNPHEGKKWLSKAADYHNPVAMRILGARLIDGVGLPKDHKTGMKWLTLAVEKEEPVAIVLLARKLLTGNSVEKNVSEGERLLRLAIDKGSTEALLILGKELLNGNTLPQNLIEGEKLLRDAVEKGDEDAMANLGMELFDGGCIAKNILEGEQLLNKAIEGKNILAKTFLGTRLIEGKSIEQNIERGEQLLREAVASDDAQAKRILGSFLVENKILSASPEEGIKLLQDAAENEDEQAMFDLSQMLLEGKSITKDEKTGKKLLRRLIQLDNADGFINLGDRYLYGNGVEKNISEGRKLLTQALEMGAGNAGAILGRFYYECGDMQLATEALLKGVKLDDNVAKNNLAFMIRRGESVAENLPSLEELLFKLSIAKELHATINYALCFAQGVQCQGDWHKADTIMASLLQSTEPVKDALSWWHEKIAAKNDPEGHLVTGWLARHGFIQDPDNMTVSERMQKARDGGWNVPDWMDSKL